MQTILVAGRSADVQVIDGPYADFRDDAGFRASCMRARALGYDGKWCIHPNQIAIANEVFSPTHDELEWANEVLAAYKEAQSRGEGAISVGNKMIDAASIRMAQRTLLNAEG
jgi:citrate lyase subunit beta/citryl-CoA lyase